MHHDCLQAGDHSMGVVVTQQRQKEEIHLVL